MPNNKFRRAFDGKRSELIDQLDLSRIVRFLEDSNVFMKSHLRQINQRSLTDDERVERFLDFLEQRPDEDFEKFVNALGQTNQQHLCDMLLANLKKTESSEQMNAVQPVSGDGLSVSGPPHIPANDVNGSDEENDFLPISVVVKHTTQQFYEDTYLDSYHMFRQCRGVACIINVCETYGYPNRTGTNVDRDRLSELFTQLHFNVVVFNDADGLTAQGIRDKVSHTARQLVDGKKPQCYVLFILSHGGLIDASKVEVLYGTDGKPLPKRDVLEALSDVPCGNNLRNVPRLVCFVSCRGNKLLKSDEADAVDILHDHFIVGFPCKEEYVSIRNPTNGTRYVQSIVQLFTEEAHCSDVETLLNKVNDKLKGMITNSGWHQIASCQHTLKRKLHLYPGYIE